MENTVKIIITTAAATTAAGAQGGTQLSVKPLGLLTTVKDLASLQFHQNQRNQQLGKPRAEIPLDLSTIKSASTVAEEAAVAAVLSSPLKKRYRSDAENFKIFTHLAPSPTPPKKRYTSELQIASPRETTPPPKKQQQPPKSQKVAAATAGKQAPKGDAKKFSEKKVKAIRRLKFDEFRSSPVSGTQIRLLHEIDENSMQESGDIDPQYNIVEITDEAKAELAQIRNVIGAYVCKLCTIEFDDAFGLARHRCSCIVLLEYRCPECGKKFNCPANLASHRRWHKPRDQMASAGKKSESSDGESTYACKICSKTFKRHAYLTKHLAMHSKKAASAGAKKSFEVHATPDTDTESDVLIPQTVFSFNRRSASPPSQPLHAASAEDNSNSSGHSTVFTATSGGSGGGGFKLIGSHFTEDESIAISALTNLRNGPSVIRHTLAV